MTRRSNIANLPSATAGRLWVLGSALLIAAASFFSTTALAGSQCGHCGDHAPKGSHHGQYCLPQGSMSLLGQHGDPFTKDGFRELDRLLDDAKLSEAQRKQIRDIRARAYTDLKVLHTEDHVSMVHGLSLLGQAKPDAALAAAEKVRQQMLNRHDKASQRLLQAQLDIANVLTPAQRAQIATRLKARHERISERMTERAERRVAHQAARTASQAASR